VAAAKFVTRESGVRDACSDVASRLVLLRVYPVLLGVYPVSGSCYEFQSV